MSFQDSVSDNTGGVAGGGPPDEGSVPEPGGQAPIQSGDEIDGEMMVADEAPGVRPVDADRMQRLRDSVGPEKLKVLELFNIAGDIANMSCFDDRRARPSSNGGCCDFMGLIGHVGRAFPPSGMSPR